MMKLSVVVNTKNSEKYLRQCLRSVKDIADEIVIVDMNSTDKTLSIAQKFTDKIWQYPQAEIGFVEPAREFAFSKAKGDWIFLLDSDEDIKPELAKLIRQVVDNQTSLVPVAEAYFIARSNIIFDRAMSDTGWYPDYQLRLWRVGSIRWLPEIHSVPKIIGTADYFPADDRNLAIVHHNYQTLAQFQERAERYSNIEAETALKTQKNFALNPEDLWQAFFAEFWRRGFAAGGLLEGNHGLVLSFLQANSELLVKSKIWEAQKFPYRPLTRPQLKRLRRRFMREAHYWWADLLVRQTAGPAKLYWQVRRKLKI